MQKLIFAAVSVLASACGGDVVHSEITTVVRQTLSTAAPGYISAFAGSGIRGWAYAGDAQLFADLNTPSGLALCPDGALYVSDTGNNRVVKFINGQMAVVAGAQLTSGPNAGLPYSNLLKNPGAESAVVTDGQIPNWHIVSPAGGWAEVPWVATRPEPLDGQQYFRANPGASGEMYQDVNIDPYAAQIDAGGQWFDFVGFVHSISADTNPDAAQIIIEYRLANGTLIAVEDSGPQRNRGEWQAIRSTRTAPIGTRKIRIRLVSTRHSGSGNDAYYDGLMFRALPYTFGRFVVDDMKAVDATLSAPHGLACDTDGTLYIADTYNNLIRSISPQGRIFTVAGRKTEVTSGAPLPPDIGDGDGVATSIPLRFPMSVALNRTPNNPGASGLKLIVTEFLSHKVRAVTTDGIFQTLLSGDGAQCPFTFPNHCTYYPTAVTPTGNNVGAPHLTVAQYGYYSVNDVLLAPSNPASYSFYITHGPGLGSVFTDNLDNPIFVSTTGRPSAVTSIVADPTNVLLNTHLAGSQFGSDSFAKNTDEVVPGLIVADPANHALRHVTVDGLVQTIVGDGLPGNNGDGGLAREARLIAPSGLAQSKDGTIYVADAEANRIRVITCADVDRCRSEVTSNGGACVYTPAVVVNDGNPCTEDKCFWPVGAEHSPYSSAHDCSDGNACNGTETCSGTECIASTPLNPGASCSDGNACNGTEICTDTQACVFGAPPSVDDGNPCTADSCSTAGGVTHTNISGVSCVVSDPCRNPGTCQSGTCNTTPIVLATGNPCVTETCNSSTGVVRTFNAVGCDGGSCVAGSCVPSGGVLVGGIDNTVPPSSAAVFAAIYDPTSGPQKEANLGSGPDQLNPDHAAHLFGSVALSDNSVPSDVKVVVLNHLEAGYTMTRSDGKFDIVANGGGPVVLRFTRAGYLPVDREAAPIWGAGAHIDDVVMVALDTKTNVVPLNSGSFSDATGTTTTAAMDARGARTARVIFPPNTSAAAVALNDAGGTTTTLNSSITVRATEFTVGTTELALQRMPAPLPAASLYTYAVDFTVDEAPNAASVVFNHPVFAYLENFLGLPTGANVPDGFYDRNKAAWVPEDNGKVIAVVGYDANGAVVDIDGDGLQTQADTDLWNLIPADQRLTAGERILIGQRYPGATLQVPKSLWRVPLTHFSVHDFNAGGGVECKNGKCPDFNGKISGGADEPKGGSCQQSGSIIGVEDQSLGEQIPVMGTPFSLNYKSSYTLGYLPPRGAEVDFDPLTNDPAWSKLNPREIRVGLSTPSGTWKLLKPAKLTNYISWDGLDSSGRRVNGSQLATILAQEVFPGSYKVTQAFGNSSDSDNISVGYSVSAGSAPDVYFTRTFTKTLAAWGADTLGLGGWTLSPMHVYDASGGILYQGDGRQRNIANGRVLRLIAGNGTETPVTGTLAVNTGIPTATYAPVVAVARNGAVYFLTAEAGTAGRRELRKVDPVSLQVVDVKDLGTDSATNSPYRIGTAMAFSADGKFLYIPTFSRILRLEIATNQVTVFAGTGVSSQADGPAAQATFKEAVSVAVAQDGTVFVADGTLVRKIATDDVHTVSTVAGSNTAATRFCGTGDPSTEANGYPAKQMHLAGLVDYNWTVSVASDGGLWIGSAYDVIRIDPSGIVSCRVHGPGEVNAGMTVASDNSVTFAQDDWQLNTNQAVPFTLRALNPDGSSTIAAGGLGCGEPVDGAVAVNSKICRVRSMAPGPDGSLYFVNVYGNSARIFQLSSPVRVSDAACVIALPSEDGLQKFCFDKDGRHLSTRNALTGAVLISFVYTNGLVTKITVDGDDTNIVRSATLVTITGPFGQATKIGLDPTTHYATYIEDASQHQTLVTHDGNGLLLSLQDRNGNLHSFAYDEMGKLKRDSDPAGGFQVLQRTDTPTGYSVSDLTAMGATQSFAVNVDSQGIEMRTVTHADQTQNQSVTDRSGGSTTTFGDGRTMTTTTSTDPVSLKPYDSNIKTTFPSGGLTTTMVRTKALVGSMATEQVFLNGAAPFTQSFNSSTKTYGITTPVSTTSPAGRTSTVVVDALNRPITVSPSGVASTTYHYDRGRLDSVIQGTRQTQLFYNPVGSPQPGYLNRIKVTDGSGAISTILVPDDAGRPVKSTTCAMDAAETSCASAPIETDFGWDFEGNLKSVTPPGKLVHTQTYTPTNLLESYIPPAVTDVPVAKTGFFYDRDGNPELVQQPGNRYVDYLNDPATGRLLSDGNAQFDYYPSSSSPGWTKGLLRTVQTSAIAQTFTYNGPLPTGEVTAWSNGSANVTRGYNADLRLQTEAVSATASASTATYGYDVDGLLTCASLSTCDSGASNRLVLTYSANTGALTGTTFGTISDLYIRNAYGELAQYTSKAGNSPLFNVSYDDSDAHARDGFGRVKFESDLITGSSHAYTYDEQGRLAYVSRNGQVQKHYTYDANGNRLSISPTSTTPIAVYDPQDRLLSYAPSPDTSFQYTYWPNGELRTRKGADGGVAEFTYSPLGYLSGGTLANGTSFSYAHDGFGRRVQKTAGSTTTRYVYRDGLRITAVLDGTGVLLSRFVYASRQNVPDLMVLADGSTVFRIISDQLGSPRVVVRASGAAAGTIVEKIDYDEFGNPTITLPSGDAFPSRSQPFGFAGGLFDEDTGFVHFGARDYDPSVGRWISKDPILFGGGQSNLFVYAGNDPVNHRDPSGRVIVSAAANQSIAQAGALWDAASWLVGQAGAEWTSGNYGGALITGAEGLAVGLASVLSNPSIDAGGLGMPLAPGLSADRKALHELTKEAMGIAGEEMTRAQAEILTEWAREQGTKGLIHGPHEPPIDFPHAHIDSFDHIPICEK